MALGCSPHVIHVLRLAVTQRLMNTILKVLILVRTMTGMHMIWNILFVGKQMCLLFDKIVLDSHSSVLVEQQDGSLTQVLFLNKFKFSNWYEAFRCQMHQLNYTKTLVIFLVFKVFHLLPDEVRKKRKWLSDWWMSENWSAWWFQVH